MGNDNDVRDVVYGPDGALAGAEAGAGRFEPRIVDGRFSRREHHEFVTGHAAGIAGFRTMREAAFAVSASSSES